MPPFGRTEWNVTRIRHQVILSLNGNRGPVGNHGPAPAPSALGGLPHLPACRARSAQPRAKPRPPDAAQPCEVSPREPSPRSTSIRCPQCETCPQTRSADDAITPLANFYLFRKPLIEHHLPRPTTPIPPPIVRFGPTKTDNQSAGKLRLGFRPYAAPLRPCAVALTARHTPAASVFDNRIQPRKSPAPFPRVHSPPPLRPALTRRPPQTPPGRGKLRRRNPNTTGQNRTNTEPPPSLDLPQNQRVTRKSTPLESLRKFSRKPDKQTQTGSRAQASGNSAHARFSVPSPAAFHAKLHGRRHEILPLRR
jgi:hypothetical protein